MSEDWRLRVDLHEDGHARALTEHLSDSGLEHELESTFGDRVAVSRDGAGVFCYTGTRQQAQEAERLIHSLAAQHGWHIDAELTRWHPAAEEWEDPDKPLPEDSAGRVAERAELMERENQEARDRGHPEFEVRVQCASHGDAVQFAEQLRDLGLPIVQRWKYLLIAAENEDSAKALAERLRLEAPAGSTVTAEGSEYAVYAELPPNPFAILGGMGG